MSTPYEETGRTSQKKRTRDLLISVTRQLVQQGAASPTVEQVAVAAGVSRTTAYRYFADQRALFLAAHPEIDRTSLLEAESPTDPEARFLAVVDAFTTLVVETELQLRTMLRLSLAEPATTDLPLRQGRAVGWFEDALKGLQPAFSDDQLRRFV
ncbi:MAG: TetR/AcrR family transcriptional regulator, partial [Nocardioidaceae bacterium]